MDNLYNPDIIQAYAGKQRGELDPHLFAIAEDAFRYMVRDQRNQTIVVSGESGAGKTVSAKYIMRYFATVEDSSVDNSQIIGNDNAEAMSETEEQILATNPILEAFGNSKTTRNDNSSRFGKYLEILFDTEKNIIGAKIRTYLLERSRLVYQPLSERNYHIFYQLCVGADDELKEKLGLKDASQYFYLNQGGDIKIENVDDVNEFKITRDALDLVGMLQEIQYNLFEILTALLFIGNIEITATRNDSILSADEPNLVKACSLLGIDSEEFAKWIIKKQITTRNEKIITNLNFQQATVARDSVAKYIYSSIFDWLVNYINAGLCPKSIEPHINSFIGVLDIYGFEHFEKNSFEQFCINYANEKLQQEFNQHVFKLEQEEYIREEIDWEFIQFTDNQPCINLIESKLGILSLLDEESRLPSGNDDSWLQKLYNNLDVPPTNVVFKKPRFGSQKFIIAHYAVDVAYDAEGFIEKNRDTVADGHSEALRATTNPLLKEIFEAVEVANARLTAAAGKKLVNRKPTLGSIFKTSLIELMNTINSTNVHYIRCIKPNMEKEAWKWSSLMVLSQLRACGVLETIRISTAGFPTRWTYDEFAQRYYMLIPSNEWSNDSRDLCQKILNQIVDLKQKYQTGNTKIFFKAGMLAYFERKRSNKLYNCAVIIQKNLRMIYYRNSYREILKSLAKLQSLVRGHMTRVFCKNERERQAATKIQSLARGFLLRKEFNQDIHSIIEFESRTRGYLIRRRFLKIRVEGAAIIIQRWWKGYHARKEYAKMRRGIIYTQSSFRRRLAYKELVKLKVDAKSAKHFKEVSYQLENKVVELTQTLAAKKDENKTIKDHIAHLEKIVEQGKAEREELVQREKELEAELKQSSQDHLTKVRELEASIAAIEAKRGEALDRISFIETQNEDILQQVKEKEEELSKYKSTIEDRNVTQGDLNKTIDDLRREIETLTSETVRLQEQQKVTQVTIENIGAPSKFRKTPTSGRRRSLSPSKWNGPGLDISGGNGRGPRPVSVAFPNHRRVSSINNGNSTLNGSYDDDNNTVVDYDYELVELLKDSRHLYREVTDLLIKDLKVSAPSVAVNLLAKEVLFPARIVIIILSDMWRLGLIKESERFLSEVFQAIQQHIISYKEDDIGSVGTFWLSNVHEMLSFVTHAHMMIVEGDGLIDVMGEEEYNEYLNLASIVKEDFESLGYNIYHTWLKKMRKLLDKTAVHAVVLSQSLPGFMTVDTSPFLSKMFTSAPQHSMDDITNLFNNLEMSMKAYCLEPEVMRGAMLELLRYIDVICFNDLLMRRNFLSWKRGLQLNYNVTKLEEWCKAHDIPEGSALLVHLFQVAKLLQLKKASIEDIEIIYDICYALKPSQIQKLLTQYYVADYEPPISQEILQAIAQKVREAGSSDDKLFEAVNSNELGDPFENVEVRQFTKIEAYVPAWLQAPTIKRITELVASNAEKSELKEVSEGDLLKSRDSDLENGVEKTIET